jgi:polar amino acid transport system substrate-binding protein
MDPEARSQLAPGGVLRAGINLGNPVIAQADPGGGDPRGVGPDLARELARRAGVPLRFVTFDSAGKMADAATRDAWDVAFLATDPARAVEIQFSAPYLHIEGAYLVRDESPFRVVEDLDRKGVRIAVGEKTAYDLFLTRSLKQAQLVRASTSQAAIDAFLAGALDAAAGVRQPLLAASRRLPGLRVLEQGFMLIGQAAGVPRGRPAAAEYLAAFIEEARRSGFVERSLMHDQPDLRAALLPNGGAK